MGVERAVTRWYLLRQPILDEIVALEAQLQHLQEQGPERPANSTGQPAADLMQRLHSAQHKLHALGPCPKPMMG